jgi:cobyrinic acid a,c-diamide synthase
MISAQLQYALTQAVMVRRRSKSLVVEDALWRELGRMTARDKAKLIQRLKYVDALISEIVAMTMIVQVAGQVRVAGQATVNVHGKEARQERRNELSQKIHAATNQVFDLAQTEALAEESKMRGEMYSILAHLASVDALILKDAAEEEILDAMEKLREEQREFEEATRELEAETKDPAGKK